MNRSQKFWLGVLFMLGLSLLGDLLTAKYPYLGY